MNFKANIIHGDDLYNCMSLFTTRKPVFSGFFPTWVFLTIASSKRAGKFKFRTQETILKWYPQIFKGWSFTKMDPHVRITLTPKGWDLEELFQVSWNMFRKNNIFLLYNCSSLYQLMKCFGAHIVHFESCFTRFRSKLNYM